MSYHLSKCRNRLYLLRRQELPVDALWAQQRRAGLDNLLWGHNVVHRNIVNLPRYRLLDELKGVDGRKDRSVAGEFASGEGQGVL